MKKFGPLAVATISLPFDEFRKKILKNKKEVEEKKMKQRYSAVMEDNRPFL